MPRKHPLHNPKRIEDYAIIGDLESAALVGRDGSLDWLCWPRFDSPSVFAALVGNVDNGLWRIAPKSTVVRVHREYRKDTLILETHMTTRQGTVAVVDFMPVRTNDTSRVVRIVRGVRGRVRMNVELVFRFDYGSIVPWVTRIDDHTLKAIAGPDMVVLRSDVRLVAEGFTHCADFMVEAGETVSFVLAYGVSYRDLPQAIDPQKALQQTEEAWQGWLSRYSNNGPYSAHVARSLITLKALTYRPTGGIVAAPTTSLPENLGGTRNWDYRYCWLRDATFTLQALMNCGFEREAVNWRGWLQRAVAGNPAQVQIMYGLAGERRLDEWQVPWLGGYENSKPVRIGNAAANQLQLDIYGEVMDALFQSNMRSLSGELPDWDLQRKLIEHLLSIWTEPDEGLWEVRGGRQHFTHSKVMAWVALDRAIKSIERFGVAGPIGKWRNARAQIHRDVCEHGYNAKLGAFVQSYGSTCLDASALLIPLVGFLPPDDPRVVSTVTAIERHLMVDGLVRRYDTVRTEDGLPGSEGAFLACSFWYADNLVLLGRRDEAKELFEYLLTLTNDVGLLAEEYDPRGQRMLGNFPQAFSHVALINTAHNLSKPEKPAEQRSGSKRRKEKA